MFYCITIVGKHSVNIHNNDAQNSCHDKLRGIESDRFDNVSQDLRTIYGVNQKQAEENATECDSENGDEHIKQ